MIHPHVMRPIQHETLSIQIYMFKYWDQRNLKASNFMTTTKNLANFDSSSTLTMPVTASSWIDKSNQEINSMQPPYSLRCVIFWFYLFSICCIPPLSIISKAKHQQHHIDDVHWLLPDWVVLRWYSFWRQLTKYVENQGWRKDLYQLFLPKKGRIVMRKCYIIHSHVMKMHILDHCTM